MKYALVQTSTDKTTKHYSWVALSDTNTREEKISIIKQEIDFLKSEIKDLQSVSKLLARRRKELKDFEELLNLLEKQND